MQPRCLAEAPLLDFRKDANFPPKFSRGASSRRTRTRESGEVCRGPESVEFSVDERLHHQKHVKRLFL